MPDNDFIKYPIVSNLLEQKEIVESIQYAKRIQTALMPNENDVDKNLKRLNRN